MPSLYCWHCPQYNEAKGHMIKCDGCFERVEQGLDPVCVGSLFYVIP
ncbi:hypothetical protein CTM97_19185 [Photobacterium phosphoreum]|uniref:4Fe-4S ferredoxin-type domain-containing protein n=1 Tax=Photobacterium phosphoreum TaxID=659 RepID=A0A2T3JYH2_PHOPO|nr:hypothetical protein CTM96_00740 [Photobacterium phosphoreum]PSU38386.1 hypothetical protein CTM97_19185 [Photobacterium phosphoreum]PSU54440.1 hypothetical protein C9J18_02870 [Photobacterium phosphoreum]